jgi:hypothetical protein
MADCRCGCITWVAPGIDRPDPGFPRRFTPGPWEVEQENGVVEWSAVVLIKIYDCETLKETQAGASNQTLPRFRYSQYRIRPAVPVVRRTTILGIPIYYVGFRGASWPGWSPWWRIDERQLSDKDALPGIKPCWDGGPGC